MTNYAKFICFAVSGAITEPHFFGILFFLYISHSLETVRTLCNVHLKNTKNTMKIHVKMCKVHLLAQNRKY